MSHVFGVPYCHKTPVHSARPASFPL